MTQLPVRIAGRATTAADTLPVHAPYGGELLAEVPRCTVEDVDRAVAAARTAESLPAWRRAEILDRAAEALAAPERSEEFARIIARESAKPLRTARGEVARAGSTFRFASAVCRGLAGEMLPLDASAVGEGRLGFAMRVPIGVVGAITPFNFPLNLVVHKLAPAIAAGCPLVLKPAEQTPLTALALSELLLDDCGLPDAWLHVVTGIGEEVGAALVAHEDVAMITFTGSPDVGWHLRARAPRKKVSLELGNNSAVIVEQDGDVEDAAAKIAAAGFAHAGQSCISVQRVLVHEDVADEFTADLVHHVERLVVGDPMDETTDVSALIDAEAVRRVTSWIDEAVKAGAVVRFGGTVDDDGVLAPTVLTNVEPNMRVCRDEVFGPLVTVQTYHDVDEALQLANGSRYGLHAGIFTSQLEVARRAISELDVGGVIVNDVPTWRADQMPYGGRGDSGNTREGPAYTVLEMTELRSVVIA